VFKIDEQVKQEQGNCLHEGNGAAPGSERHRNRAEEARGPKVFYREGETPSSVSARRELCC
jgi:hypothetical protein